jgi:hypothetical protein
MPETVVATRSFTEKLDAARIASHVLATANAALKNRGLEAIAAAIVEHAHRIIAANDLDLANGRDNGLRAGMQDRLALDERSDSPAWPMRFVLSPPSSTRSARTCVARACPTAFASAKCECRSGSSA